MDVRYLRELIKDLDDDVEVRLMTQPNYPFEYSIKGGITHEDLIDWQVDNTPPGEDNDLFEPASGNDPGYFGRGPWAGAGILYLLEDQQLGYGTRDTWTAEEELFG